MAVNKTTEHAHMPSQLSHSSKLRAKKKTVGEKQTMTKGLNCHGLIL